MKCNFTFWGISARLLRSKIQYIFLWTLVFKSDLHSEPRSKNGQDQTQLCAIKSSIGLWRENESWSLFTVCPRPFNERATLGLSYSLKMNWLYFIPASNVLVKKVWHRRLCRYDRLDHQVLNTGNSSHQAVLRIRIRCLFDTWIRDPGWEKIKIWVLRLQEINMVYFLPLF
jgi:hypothetical protein